MKSYSGSTDFEYNIERYYDLKYYLSTNQKIFLLEKDLDSEIEYEIETINLYISGSGHFYPGNYSGLPENCYPDDCEVEILSVQDENNTDYYDFLTEDEIENIHDLILKNIENNCDNDDRDYDDFNY